MTSEIVQLITSFLGSLGFAFIFNTRKKALIPSALGGVVCWGVYLLGSLYFDGQYIPSLFAAAAVALYAEIAARVLKLPATIVFISAIIPLIPGSSLYYTMSYAVSGDLEMFGRHGMETIYYILGITSGISFVWSMWYMVQKIYRIYIKKAEV